MDFPARKRVNPLPIIVAGLIGLALWSALFFLTGMPAALTASGALWWAPFIGFALVISVVAGVCTYAGASSQRDRLFRAQVSEWMTYVYDLVVSPRDRVDLCDGRLVTVFDTVTRRDDFVRLVEHPRGTHFVVSSARGLI